MCREQLERLHAFLPKRQTPFSTHLNKAAPSNTSSPPPLPSPSPTPPPCRRLFLQVAPPLSEEDRRVVDNVSKLVNFLSGGSAARALSGRLDPRALQVCVDVFSTCGFVVVCPELATPSTACVAASIVV